MLFRIRSCPSRCLFARIWQRAAHVAALTSLYLSRASGARVRLARQSCNLFRGSRLTACDASRGAAERRSGGGGGRAPHSAPHTQQRRRQGRATIARTSQGSGGAIFFYRFTASSIKYTRWENITNKFIFFLFFFRRQEWRRRACNDYITNTGVVSHN